MPCFLSIPQCPALAKIEPEKVGEEEQKNSRHCLFSKFKLLRPKPSWGLAEGNKSFKSHTRARLQIVLDWLEILVMKENRDCGIDPACHVGRPPPKKKLCVNSSLCLYFQTKSGAASLLHVICEFDKQASYGLISGKTKDRALWHSTRDPLST